MEKCTHFLYAYKFKEQLYVIASHFLFYHPILPLGFFFFFFWGRFENYRLILFFKTQFFFLNILCDLGFFFTYKLFVWSLNYNSNILVKPNLISNLYLRYHFGEYKSFVPHLVFHFVFHQSQFVMCLFFFYFKLWLFYKEG